VTHDMDEAFALGDRVGVLERGRVTFERPAMTR
jgi:ABC-type proline/glycine betaine transport system ATPase subunit